MLRSLASKLIQVAHHFAKPTAAASYQLQPGVRQQVSKNLAARSFQHVTPESNIASILEHGLSADFAGGGAGLSGTDKFDDYKPICEGKVFLGKDRSHWLTRLVYPLNPTVSYQYIFRKLGIKTEVIDIILPIADNPFDHGEIKAMLAENTLGFAVDAATLDLIRRGEIRQDLGDTLPGRFYNKGIPGCCIFAPGTGLANKLRPAGTIGADQYISDRVLDALTSDVSELADADRATKLEYVRGAAHNSDDAVHPIFIGSKK